MVQPGCASQGRDGCLSGSGTTGPLHVYKGDGEGVASGGAIASLVSTPHTVVMSTQGSPSRWQRLERLRDGTRLGYMMKAPAPWGRPPLSHASAYPVFILAFEEIRVDEHEN